MSRCRSRLLAAALALSLPAAQAYADTAPLKIERIARVSTSGKPVPAQEVLAEEVLLQFDPAATPAQRASALSAVSGTIQQVLHGWTVVTLPPGSSVAAAMNTLRSQPGVSAVAPDQIYRPLVVPNDPSVTQQYALQQVNAFAAWEYERGLSNKVTVVVIDSGIDGTHPDLSGKTSWTGASAVKHQSVDNGTGALTPEATPSAACIHGTQAASVAAASTNNNSGIAGMSWGAQLLSLKVFNAGCGGATSDCLCVTTDKAISAALDYVTNTVAAAGNAATVGKVVVSMSLGASENCGGANSVLTKASLTNLIAAGVPAAIATGNQPSCTGTATDVNAPANCAGQVGGLGVIPVGATDAANNVTSYSCTGPELAAHGLVAPGDKILVDTPGGGTSTNSGTSFATPYVAGLMALMLSAKPNLTTAQVETYLRGGADSIGGASLAAGVTPSGNITGAGKMDAFRTMRLTENGTLADFAGDQKAIAFPNPFRMSQTGSVSFSIPTSLQGTNPQILIYTEDGRLVKTLNGLTWDGKNDGGNPVASGTYVFLVKTGAGKSTGRVAVIR